MAKVIVGDATVKVGDYIGVKVGGAKNVYRRKSLTSIGQYKLVCRHSTSDVPEIINVAPGQHITLYSADDIKYHEKHVTWTGVKSPAVVQPKPFILNNLIVQLTILALVIWVIGRYLLQIW